MAATKVSSGLRVRAVQRALAVLDAFSVQHPRLKLHEIANRVGLDNATTLRLVNTLCDGGLVERQEDATYRLGFRLLDLAQGCLSGLDLREVALPVMRDISVEIDETVFLCVPSGMNRVAIAQVEGSKEYRRTGGLGKHVPMHCGAPGKVLLAYANPTFIEAYLSSDSLEAVAANTISDPHVLGRSLVTIRSDGFAESVNERGNGGAGVAAPIFGFEGGLVASIAVAVPLERWEVTRDRARSLVVEGGRRISSLLGHRND